MIAIVLLGGGGSYTMHARFENASQLVNGNLVEVGGVKAGIIKDITLTEGGVADVKFTLDNDYTPLPVGTVATIRSQSLSGIANRYIQLVIPPTEKGQKTIPDGGTLDLDQTVSEVDLDQFFNTLDKPTITSFKRLVKGFARSYDGIAPQANAGFKYLNPGLSTARRVFGELNSDTRRFERLIVDTSSLSGALAQRSDDLGQLISNADSTFGAFADENVALTQTLDDLPDFMRNFNTTAVNLRAALDDADPLINASKPVARQLRPFAHVLRGFAVDAVPTITDLDQIVSRPGPDNDLTELTALAPGLAKIAVGPVRRNGKLRAGALPASTTALTRSLPNLAFFRPYLTADGISGWFDDFGHSGILDANGGVGRIGTTFNVFSIAAGSGLPDILGSPLTPTQVSALITSNQLNRCPGSNERDPGDGSTPFTDNGTINCDPTQIPTGP